MPSWTWQVRQSTPWRRAGVSLRSAVDRGAWQPIHHLPGCELYSKSKAGLRPAFECRLERHRENTALWHSLQLALESSLGSLVKGLACASLAMGTSQLATSARVVPRRTARMLLLVYIVAACKEANDTSLRNILKTQLHRVASAHR